ncbi:hypothetical protein FHR33_009738 [Nonomuraea dietziae]|uniref:Uncharacterized protein n=1 Tax=Nonomuraea dietziae TaxID=65515 RepID=A0A7W5VK55_9ACTN|nr:hypothetical protein [Nonomuraea dietziae]
MSELIRRLEDEVLVSYRRPELVDGVLLPKLTPAPK